MRKLLIIAVVFLFILGKNSLYGQGELSEEQKIFIRNERSFGLLLYTDGFGLSFREGKRIDFLNKKILEIELSTLKNPKEIKLSNPYYQSPGSFVFGKLNSTLLLRGGIGRQHEIYKKADLGGVAIKYFYSGGPVIAFYKPIYYKIIVSPTQYLEEKFDINRHDPTMIYGKASFLKGIRETKLIPGIFAKGGFNFEYSKQDKIIHAIELGAMVSLFPKKIPIMSNSDNRAVFFSLFASYRFGIVLDPLNPESNKFSKLFSRKRQ
jgi:hypothetical protein